MEVSKKDIAEVGQAVENLGRLIEEQFQSVQQKLNHLSRFASEVLNNLKSLQGRVGGVEAEIEEVKEKLEELNTLEQEFKGFSRNFEKISEVLRELQGGSDKSD
jgi:DNA repair exonuclease SbcCD ATPase subunit